MNFTYILKDVADLSEKEIDDMFHLNVRMYPDFEEIYKVNKYYSYTKPKKLLMAYENTMLLADANYSWRKIYLQKQNMYLNFAYFGILVETEYQKQGIGKEIIKQFQEETKYLQQDGLFASTQSDVMKNLLQRLDFMPIKSKLLWFNPQTDEHILVQNDRYSCFWWSASEKGKMLLNENVIFLGTGPI